MKPQKLLLLPCLVLAALNSCKDLALTDTVSQAVVEYKDSLNPKPRLTVLDGSTVIAYGGSMVAPDTIHNYTSSKTLTLRNDGTADLNLSAPGVKTGSPYFGIGSPAQARLSPGQTTTVTVSFAPVTRDQTYTGEILINSDDPLHSAYLLNTSGLSTAWRGVTILTSSGMGSVVNPKIRALADHVFVTYDYAGIQCKYNTTGDEVANWETENLLASTGGGYQIAANAPRLHLVLKQTGTLEYHRYSDANVTLATPDGIINSALANVGDSPNNSAFSTNSGLWYYGGSIYIAYKDTSTNKLSLGVGTENAGAAPISMSSNDIITPALSAAAAPCPSLKNLHYGYLALSWVDGSKVPHFSWRNSVYTWSHTDFPAATTQPTLTSFSPGDLSPTTTEGLMVWDDGAAIRFSHAADATGSWSTPASIGSETLSIGGYRFLQVAWAKGAFCVYYICEPVTPGMYQLRQARTTDGGATWTYQDIGSSVSSYQEISVAASDNIIYIAHHLGTDLLFRKSLDGGQTW